MTKILAGDSERAVVRVNVFYGDDLDEVNLVEMDLSLLRELQSFVESGQCGPDLLGQMTTLIPDILPAFAEPVTKLSREAREYLVAAYACRTGEPVGVTATFQRQMK